jgi:hypothetical protein
MRTLLSALTVAVLSAGLAASQDDERKVPKDSLEVVVVGCVKGRFLTTTRTPRVVDGDDLDARVDRFQITGKKAILDDVKKHDRGEVEIVGFVRKRDLKEPGIKVPGGRVIISAGRGGDRYPPPPTGPQQRVVPIDVRSVRALDGVCER